MRITAVLLLLPSVGLFPAQNRNSAPAYCSL